MPASTLPELIAYAKANPNKITIASAGTGSTGHLAGELLKMLTGISLVHVPYRGNAPAPTDVLSGQVQAFRVRRRRDGEATRLALAQSGAIICAIKYPPPITAEELRHVYGPDFLADNINVVEFHEEVEYVVDSRALTKVEVVRCYPSA